MRKFSGKMLVYCITILCFVSCRKANDMPGQLSLSPSSPTAIRLTNNSNDFDQLIWTTVKGQPVPTHETNGDVLNGKLYIFGGHDFLKRPQYWTQTLRSYVYDPATNEWTTLADLPYLPKGANFGGVSNAGITNDGTFIYLAGGYVCNANGTGQVFATKQVWRYDPNTNNYDRLPDLPRALAAAQLKYLNGKLHFLGGADLSRNDVNSHFVLNLNNTLEGWKTAASLPNAVNQSGSVVLNGKIYLVGGGRGYNSAIVAQKTLQVYDDATNKWTLLAPMNVARSHIGSGVIASGNRLIVLGGETKYNTTSSLVSAYSVEQNAWTELSSLPSARSGGVAGTINGQLYYAGGNFVSTLYKGMPVVANDGIVLNTTADSYVRDGSYSNQNYGSDTALIVKGSKVSGYSRYVLVKFSLANISNVNSAKLRLFGSNVDNTGDITLSCYGLTSDDWVESALTYSSMPTALSGAAASAIVGNQAKIIEFDITDLLKSTLSSGRTELGLLIRDAANKNVTIAMKSKEGFGNGPQLVVVE